jgi:hypothetical protein
MENFTPRRGFEPTINKHRVFKKASVPGLPDGIFSNQISQFEYILEGLGMENVVTKMVWPFGIYCGHLVFLGLFGNLVVLLLYLVSRKIWQPCFVHA